MKIRAVNFKGGKCEKCGYDKCIAALEFHHLDPSKKEFGIGNYHGKWSVKQKELEKCIMLCSNCHSEEHYKEFQPVA